MIISFTIATALGEALALLAGCWEGQLEYRDYQSDQMAEIPIEACYTPSPDYTYVSADTVFTDPGFKVYSHGVRQPLHDDMVLRDVSFRDGEMDVREKTVELFVVTVDGFALELEEVGIDGEDPATIREVIRLYGDEYVAEKFVTPHNQSESQFRNRIYLQRKTNNGDD